MKKLTIILIVTLILLAIVGVTIFILAPSSHEPTKLGSDTVFVGSESKPFKEVASRLEAMLHKTPKEQTIALSALQGNPLLVKNTALLQTIIELAAKDEDYSKLDEAVSSLKATQSDEPILDKELLAVGERAQVRQLAMFIAVVNESPEAIKEVKELNASHSLTKKEIASSANKWVELHGSASAPKPDPLLYGSRVVPFERFVTDVTSDISSGDVKKQNTGVSYVIRNLEMKQFTGQPREILVGLLKSFMDNSSANPGSEGYSLKLAVVPCASLSGGPTAKALLLQLANSGDTPISEAAARSLDDFSTLHPDEK